MYTVRACLLYFTLTTYYYWRHLSNPCKKLVTICATELASLDMSINGNKLVCMIVGPCFNKYCANISVQDGQELNWVQSCRYLGIITVESASHICNTKVN